MWINLRGENGNEYNFNPFSYEYDLERVWMLGYTFANSLLVDALGWELAHSPQTGSIWLDNTVYPEGYYDYTIYEVTAVNIYDVDDANTIAVLEEGVCYIKEDSTAINDVTYTEHDTTERDYSHE